MPPSSSRALPAGSFDYVLLDEVVDGYFMVMAELQDRVETLEERLV